MIDTPTIIPSLRNWVGFDNYLTLPMTCRLVIDSNHFEELAETAKILQTFLCALTNRMPAVSGDLTPDKGDIFLTLDTHDQEIGEQGYILEIDKSIKLQANTATGIFYGEQTLLQMLEQDPAHDSLPRGLVRDYPSFPTRGVMLDAGRKYWKMDYLYKTVRQMARLKLNILHLHLSDWSDFRLQSDRLPGLAASRAYSKTEIAALQAYASQWHVTILPEIDLPAHATVFTRYDPTLAFTSDVMSKPRWPGGEYGGFTLDYTNPKVRHWIKDLLEEFIPLFDGPYFHIGCDEVASPEYPEQCPALANYARAKEYPYMTDVLVEWINEMNAFIKSYGKQMQIWNWWERTPHSINPDGDIGMDVWAEAANPSPFLDAGYQVVNSPEDLLYLTPGINLFPDCSRLFNEWEPVTHPNMLGYKLCVWADQCEHGSDEYFESLLCQPRVILAERTWNPRKPSGSLEKFLAAARAVMSGDRVLDI
jgi:hexosaminidase